MRANRTPSQRPKAVWFCDPIPSHVPGVQGLPTPDKLHSRLNPHNPLCSPCMHSVGCLSQQRLSAVSRDRPLSLSSLPPRCCCARTRTTRHEAPCKQAQRGTPAKKKNVHPPGRATRVVRALLFSKIHPVADNAKSTASASE